MILIRHCPENLSLYQFFNLRFRNGTTLFESIQDDADFVIRHVLLTKVINDSACVPQCRHLCHRDDVQLIRMAEQLICVVVEACRFVDQDELVRKPQEIEHLRDRARTRVTSVLEIVRRRQDVEPARVMERNTLQELGIKSVGVFHQLVCMVFAVRKAQIQGGVAQTRMQVEQKSLFGSRTSQQSAELGCYCCNAAAAFRPDKGHDLRVRAFLSFTPAAAGTGNRLQQLIADKRLEEVLAATASHRLDDDIWLGVGRNGEDSRVRQFLTNMLCNEECFAGVLVKIDETNVRN